MWCELLAASQTMKMKDSLKKKILKKLFDKNQIYKLRRIKFYIPNLLCSFFSLNNEIIMESHPDLTCNTFELFRFIMKKGLNKEWKVTWLVSNPEKFKSQNNVDFIEIEPKTITGKIKKYFRCNRAKVLINCNRHYELNKTNKQQLNIYIVHGSPFKWVHPREGGLMCTYVVSQSSFFNKALIDMFEIKESQIINTGFPRNDQLFRHDADMKKIITDYYKYNKVFVWVPTFRKHKNGVRIDCDHFFPFGLPLLYTKEDIIKLNNCLVKFNALVIVKPHPAQDLRVIKDLNSSNIRFLSNEELLNADIQTNEFLAETDAMIGDYSGIYYDYLLLDKPIGISLDDFEEYKAQMGIVFDNPLDVLKGYYLYNINDLLDYVEMVCKGVDPKLLEREKIKYLTNETTKANATERLYCFVDQQMKMRFGDSLQQN